MDMGHRLRINTLIIISGFLNFSGSLADNYIIRILSVGLVIFIAFSLFLYIKLILARRSNRKLSETNKLISEQKEQMIDNILMAQNLQRAVLPPEKLLGDPVKEYFILNRPRDILSGDFYWAGTMNGKLAIAVADCTGHGVHGAIMSMFGMAFLNEIAHRNLNYEPNEVLFELNKRIVSSLHNFEDEYLMLEGMDMVFCTIDRKKLLVKYAGAKNPIFIHQDGEIKIYTGNRIPIGHYENIEDFIVRSIKVKPGNTIYMFSDGYMDQFGENEKKRFSKSRFIKLLNDISNKPIIERSKILEAELDDWRGNQPQIDDILIVGVVV
jgi:serine phosphatase RsbU (regulator of sigma subunit)